MSQSVSSLITHLQIFGIGLTFAIAGPCLFLCTPILVTYLTARRDNRIAAFTDIAVFLCGRLFAYVILGALAGLSGYYLRLFTETDLAPYLNIASGIISIALGLSILARKNSLSCSKSLSGDKIYSFGSVLTLGFLVGISPCAPLTALLFEIALMSKGALEGAAYALSFALGTFIAGVLVISSITGILKGFALKLIRSEAVGRIFNVCCAALLVIFGVGIIRGAIKAL